MKHILMLLLLSVCPFLHAQKHQNEMNFDRDWLFARYGLQADGTKLDEPASLEQVTLNDSQWRKLDLPHDWGIEGPFRSDLDGFTGKLPWKGIGWYRKHFNVSGKDKNNCFYLDFDGAMANAEVWLNGHKVGERPFGYISFRVDLTPYLNFGGDNVVAVRLDTEKLGSRWYPGAGIYRHVRLVKTAPLHIAHWGVFVTTPTITAAFATARIDLQVQNKQNKSADCEYKVEIFELDEQDRMQKKVAQRSKKTLPVAANEIANDSIYLTISNPKLWDLEHTNRYLARVNVYDKNKLVDSYDTPFGIRTIQFTHDNGFLLNGTRVEINGTCNHHDLGALGAAINTSALQRQLTILKSMGCNALRTSHNPPAPELLTLADKMGFLVMDEAFDTWTFQKKKYDYGYLYKDWHERDIESLICRDRNHPSVILWSTGNEVDEEYRPEIGEAQHLTDVVHRFDLTRPATFGASYPSKSGMNGTEYQVDVHGINYAVSGYGGPDFYGDFLNKEGHELIAAYSSESSSTMSSRGEYFTREYQVSSYDTWGPGWGGLPDQEFAALDKYRGIAGEFVWTGFDYLGEPTPFNSDESVLLNFTGMSDKAEIEKRKKELEEIEKKRPTSRSSYFGIVDLAGFPKDRYYLYQSRWLPDLPMAHILPHWNFPDKVNDTIPVYVYTSGDEAELFLNGKSLGRKKKQQYEYRLKWNDVVYQPGTLTTVAYKNGAKWAEDTVKTTGKAVKLKVTPEKTTIKADGEDLVFIRISFLDADGNEVPTAEDIITCSIKDQGQIVATDNGDPTCLITFSKPSRPAFNGLFLAIVKADRNQKQPIYFIAEADGLGKTAVEINVEK